MNKLIKYFNNKYSKGYGKISYPRTTIQIYRVYQTIKSYGINDKELIKLLHNVKLPTPKNTEEWEMYVCCLYNKDDSEINDSIPCETKVEEGKLYLLKESGEKIDQGTELPTIQEQIGENKTIQIFTDLATTEVTFDAGSTILQSLDTLINTVDIQINQVFRGQSRAKDNPISGNCEIQIEILKVESMSGARDIVCQVTLTSTTNSPYKWIMLTRRMGDDKISEISVPLTPMLFTGENPVFTGSMSMNRKEGTTIGEYSVAIGKIVEASGGCSYAEGKNTTASGWASHAEGEETKAKGQTSHAEGEGTNAYGKASHVEGSFTTASSDYQHVQGKYNIEDKSSKYAHIVGNGKSGMERSNAHTLDWNGNAWFAGKLTQEGTPTEDKDLITKKYFDDNITAGTSEDITDEEFENALTENGISILYSVSNQGVALMPPIIGVEKGKNFEFTFSGKTLRVNKVEMNGVDITSNEGVVTMNTSSSPKTATIKIENVTGDIILSVDTNYPV